MNEDYKKLYKQALKRAKYLKENTDSVGALDVSTCFEEIFPELRESEDERIKRCIQVALTDVDENRFNDYDTTLKDCIAWLEKQGEQKSTDSYCQENCKGFQETGKCFADGECKAKIEAEQKSAWSEEDEKMLSFIDAILEYAYNNNSIGFGISCIDLKMWLKSIKSNHWKPSEEQMKALAKWLKNHQYDGDSRYIYPIFQSLYNDLKNL